MSGATELNATTAEGRLPMPLLTRLSASLQARWSHWLQRLDARRQPRWADELDLLGGAPPAAWWAWALLALGALALILLGWARQDVAEAQDQADARLRQAQHFAQQAELRTRLAAADALRGQDALRLAVNQQTLRAASRVVQQLAYPWAEVLDGVEAASGDVALLGLRHDTQSGEVQLDAAVRDDLMALKWVDALSADHAHFAQAYLQSRAPLQQPVGELGTRVQLVAVLNPRIQAAAPVLAAASAAATAASAAVAASAPASAAAAAAAPATVVPTRVAHVEVRGQP